MWKNFYKYFVVAGILNCGIAAAQSPTLLQIQTGQPVVWGSQPQDFSSVSNLTGVCSSTQDTCSLLKPIAIRSTYAMNAVATQVTIPGTFRQYYQVSARGPVTSISVCYLNAVNVSNTEAAGPNTLTISSSLELWLSTTVAPFAYTQSGTTLLQFTFRGAATASLIPSALTCSDELAINLASNQSFYIRTYTSAAGSGTFPNIQGLNGTLQETSNNGSFSTTQSAVGTGAQTSFSGTLSGLNITLPIVAGTLRMSGSIPVATDNGSGVLAGTGISSGTINYTTGAWTLVFTVAPANGAVFIATGLGNAGATPGDETMTASPSDFSTPSFNAATVPAYLPSYGPNMILGRIAKTIPQQHSVCLIGDSIISGVGNSDGAAYPEYSGNQTIGFIRGGQPSETAASFAAVASSFRRMKMLTDHCDRVYGNYGTNDINAGSSVAAIEANLLTIWSKLAAILPHGYKDITWSTILPRTVSNASQAPLSAPFYGSGSVASGNPSVRNALNAWICSQVGITIGAILDINTLVEGLSASCTGNGDGTWKSLTYTADGTHFSSTAQKTVIPAQFGSTGLTPAPVFLP